MNKTILKQAETDFLRKYPAGFLDPEMVAIGKKHKMAKMVEFAQTNFIKARFSKTTALGENMVKAVSRSSMVSLFEKPKFRDFIGMLTEKELRKLTNGLKHFLHGDQQKGFEAMVESLKQEKLAKWTLLTIIPNYFYPDEEVFVKPTTTKGIIEKFELTGINYKPLPSWEFYQAYREQILEMKSLINPDLAPSNAAFCGFLMMSLN